MIQYRAIIFIRHLLTIVITSSFVVNVQAEDKLTLVLDWSINTNHTGIVVADKLGYFAEENITLDLQAPPQTGAAVLVTSGVAHMAVSYQEEVTFARSQGLPLLAIATIIQHNTSGFATRAESGITRPRDISGKRYGGWGGAVELAILKALVEQDGGNYSSIQVMPIGDVDFFAATRSHIDVIWIFEGWDAIAAQQKGIAINYMPIAKIDALDYYTPLLITSEALADKNPNLLERALTAISRGYNYAINSPDAAAKLLLAQAPELDSTLVHTSQQFLASQYQAEAPRWGEMRLEVWQRFADWLYARDLLEGDFSPQSAYTNRFLPTNTR